MIFDIEDEQLLIESELLEMDIFGLNEPEEYDQEDQDAE